MSRGIDEHLIDTIYDAAMDNRLWPRILTDIADALSSEGGILIGQSIADSAVYYDHNGRLDPDSQRVFSERHVQNAWSLAMLPQPAGRIVLSDEILSCTDLMRTEFWHDVLRPQGLTHNIMVALANSRHFQGAFTILRSPRQGPFAERERTLLASLVPHLTRALQLQMRVSGYEALGSVEFAVLDGLSSGVVILDQAGGVVFANRAAWRHHEAGGPIQLRNRTVSAGLPEENTALATLVRSVIQGGARGTGSGTQAWPGGRTERAPSPPRRRYAGSMLARWRCTRRPA